MTFDVRFNAWLAMKEQELDAAEARVNALYVRHRPLLRVAPDATILPLISKAPQPKREDSICKLTTSLINDHVKPEDRPVVRFFASLAAFGLALALKQPKLAGTGTRIALNNCACS